MNKLHILKYFELNIKNRTLDSGPLSCKTVMLLLLLLQDSDATARTKFVNLFLQQ